MNYRMQKCLQQGHNSFTKFTVMIHKQACLKWTLTWHIAVLWKFLCSQFLHCCLYPIAWPGDVLVYRLRLIPYHTYLPKCLRRINRNIYSWLGNSFPLVYSIRKNNLYVKWLITWFEIIICDDTLSIFIKFFKHFNNLFCIPH